MTLKDLLPQGLDCPDVHDKSLDTTFRATRLEIVLLVRETPTGSDGEEEEDLEWGIPSQEVFDEAIAAAIFSFTETEESRIHSLDWSSTGWETGVGLVSISTKDMGMVNLFREAIAELDLDGQSFITMPKQMLIKKYALTIYFGRTFARFPTERLMLWLGTCNNLKGKFDIIETRNFPKNHENPKRRGARIVAFEGNQTFLDSLHRYPKDYPFNIKFGGNLYIRGGERYVTLTCFFLHYPISNTYHTIYLSLIHI